MIAPRFLRTHYPLPCSLCPLTCLTRSREPNAIQHLPQRERFAFFAQETRSWDLPQDSATDSRRGDVVSASFLERDQDELLAVKIEVILGDGVAGAKRLGSALALLFGEVGAGALVGISFN